MRYLRCHNCALLLSSSLQIPTSLHSTPITLARTLHIALYPDMSMRLSSFENVRFAHSSSSLARITGFVASLSRCKRLSFRLLSAMLPPRTANATLRLPHLFATRGAGLTASLTVPRTIRGVGMGKKSGAARGHESIAGLGNWPKIIEAETNIPLVSSLFQRFKQRDSSPRGDTRKLHFQLKASSSSTPCSCTVGTPTLRRPRPGRPFRA